MKKKFKCPCCGYLTFDTEPDNTFYICPVCFWEDDGLQLSMPHLEGGANDVSLLKARENFKKYGVSDMRFLSKVRKPLDEEMEDLDS